MGVPGRPWLPASLLLLPLLLQESHQGVYQRTLLKELMKDYNALERPVANDTHPLTVHFTLSLMQIMDVDEKNQVLTTNIMLQMYWYDFYLRWNQSDYPGVKNLRFASDQLWKPDILLYNSANEDFDSTFHTNILVNSSGYCQWLPPGVPGIRHEIFYDCCKEPYPDVTFYVTMRRRTLYYALNLLIPCVLLSTMSLLVFLLPADSGEKISLGITVLLSLTVFMLLVAEIMPATSDSIPLIGQYFASTMIIVGCSVVATVYVLQYHHHDADGGKMPKWVRIFVLKWCAWFLRMKRPGEEAEPRPQCTPSLLSCSSDSEHTTPDRHVGGPNGANGNLLYIGFRGLEDLHHTPGKTSDLLHKQPDFPASLSLHSNGVPPSRHSSEPGDPQLEKILEEVQYLADRFRGQDADESSCNEWKFAATVIDRMCLVAFTIFNIICTISILMSAPNFVEAVSKDYI
ncbi:neuronal acetylcholine receptor subunit alpha-7-like isoform X2 [Ambystoma mexicanum]|uniref:neuronal acetylcholine receptor subunit alpha-7-like isoform X2 n=1 Tax=Ambystoma mexicanum TaxID=8296 RepID=UPI0037E8ADFF